VFGHLPPVSVVFRYRSLPLLLLPLLLLAGAVPERAAVDGATAGTIGAAPAGTPTALRQLDLPAALAPHMGIDLAPNAPARTPGHASQPAGRRAAARASAQARDVALAQLAYAAESIRARLNFPTTFGNPPPLATSC
jgi:hypothetical protein